MYDALLFLFFLNDTATTEIYTLSLHDALPIYCGFEHERVRPSLPRLVRNWQRLPFCRATATSTRSEEHTSELQSRQYLVCRLLLEKKSKKDTYALQSLQYLVCLLLLEDITIHS